MNQKRLLDDPWTVRGVRPVYRRACRYLRRVNQTTVAGVINRALKMYLEAKFPEVLERARRDEEEGRPVSGYRIGPSHREDDND